MESTDVLKGDWGGVFREGLSNAFAPVCNELNNTEQDKQMKQNDNVRIEALDNGFTVTINAGGGYIGTELAFQSMKELQSFLTGHFTYRNDKIKPDAKAVPLKAD